ncbi:MAG: LAGLIDADG family homing endonuclease [Patescibacteria group bacterium]
MSGKKPKAHISKVWSSDLAYAVGLLATDGSLSRDGRHIDLTSTDKEQLKNLLSCLDIDNKIGRKFSGSSKKPCWRIQFGDVLFYRFLMDIGLTPAKSKTMGGLTIPHRYFFDVLRGEFDGDGTFYSYWDKRWKSSFMFYVVFISASRDHIEWLRKELFSRLCVNGHITHDDHKSTYQLKYAKREGLQILKNMYYNSDLVCLKRKRLKVEKALGIVGMSL